MPKLIPKFVPKSGNEIGKLFQITGERVGIEPGIEVANKVVTGFRIKAAN